MSTFSWIIAVSLAGGVLSVVAAAAVSVTLGAHRVSMLISYAIGALLGASFLEILPHALEHGEPHRMAATVLAGILIRQIQTGRRVAEQAGARVHPERA